MDKWRYQHRVSDAVGFSTQVVHDYPVDLMQPSSCFGLEATHEMMQIASRNNIQSKRLGSRNKRLQLASATARGRLPRSDLRNRSALASRRWFFAQLRQVDEEDYGNVFDPEDEEQQEDLEEDAQQMDAFGVRTNLCVQDMKKTNRMLANRLHRMLRTKNLSTNMEKPIKRQTTDDSIKKLSDRMSREVMPYGLGKPFRTKVQDEIAEIEEQLREQRISREETSLENLVETNFALREVTLLIDEVLSEELEDMVEETHEEEVFNVKGPQLLPECQQIVDAVLEGGSDDVLVSKFNVDLRRRDFQRLLPLQWLNDELINFWFQLLKERDDALVEAGVLERKSHFFNSFFYEKVSENGYNFINVRRWTRKIDLFAMDKVFVPVNISNTHWCLAVIFMTEKRIQYYDSMCGPGMRCLETLLKYLQDESQHKKQQTLDPSEWTLVPTEADTPQQNNGSDCGVFTCMFADYLARDLPLSFSQKHVRFHRQRMVLYIVSGGIPIDEEIEAKPKTKEERAQLRAARGANGLDSLMRLI